MENSPFFFRKQLYGVFFNYFYPFLMSPVHRLHMKSRICLPAAPFLTMDYEICTAEIILTISFYRRRIIWFIVLHLSFKKLMIFMINCIYYNKIKISNVYGLCIKFILNAVFYTAKQICILFCDLGTLNLYSWRQKVRCSLTIYMVRNHLFGKQ